MKDRINLLIKAKNLTAAQFADEIGVQKSSISHILSGRNNASLDFIQKVLLSYPEVSMEWLMFGKGPIFKSPETIANGSNDRSSNVVHAPGLPPVDLFSDLFPAQGKEFHAEKDLSADINSNVKYIEKEYESEPVDPIKNIDKDKTHDYPEITTIKQVHKNGTAKPIVKIVEFYSDNTFREYFPE